MANPKITCSKGKFPLLLSHFGIFLKILLDIFFILLSPLLNIHGALFVLSTTNKRLNRDHDYRARFDTLDFFLWNPVRLKVKNK